MKNPFKSQPPPPEPQTNPAAELQNKINELEKQSFKLLSRIMASGNILTEQKQSLITKRAKILQQIDTLKTQQNTPKEQEAISKINELFNNPKYTKVIEVNGNKVTLDENLNMPLTFHPCKHKLRIHAKELLRHQREPINEQVLLSKWQPIFSRNTTLTAKFTCEECRKAMKKRREQTHIDKHTTIGTVDVTMTIL